MTGRSVSAVATDPRRRAASSRSPRSGYEWQDLVCSGDPQHPLDVRMQGAEDPKAIAVGPGLPGHLHQALDPGRVDEAKPLQVKEEIVVGR